MDNLEKFVKEYRSDLDRYEPSKGTWRKIKAGLKTKREILPVWLSAAAIVIVILGAAIFLYFLYQKKNIDYSAENSGQHALKETEVYYNTLVNTLYIEAKPLLTNQPEIARELNTGMAQIDSICADLKKDLKDNVANQEVIEALIQNYRIKLQLLEDMLTLLKQQENKSEKNKSHAL